MYKKLIFHIIITLRRIYELSPQMPSSGKTSRASLPSNILTMMQELNLKPCLLCNLERNGANNPVTKGISLCEKCFLAPASNYTAKKPKVESMHRPDIGGECIRDSSKCRYPNAQGNMTCSKCQQKRCVEEYSPSNSSLSRRRRKDEGSPDSSPE
jgi:hypothetical protein